MKGHATLIEQHNAPRCSNKIGKIVKEHIANTPSQNHTECTVKDKVTDLLGRPTTIGLLSATQAQPPCPHKPHQIHKPIPMHLYGAKRKRSEEHTSELQSRG